MKDGDSLTKCTGTSYTSAGGNPFSKPWCTWYAWGRAKEKGRTLSVSGNAAQWALDAKKTEPKAGYVASFSGGSGPYPTEGHVVYIEEVSNGTVFFTEGSGYRDAGVVSSKSTKDFKTLWGYNLRGYI